MLAHPRTPPAVGPSSGAASEHPLQRVLVTASPGGHVEEVHVLLPRFGLDDVDLHWVTSRTAQTEALLADQQVHWVGPVASNELGRAARGLPIAMSLQRRLRPDLVISAGAALTAPHMIAAAAHRCDLWYVESAARFDGPSLTGSLAQRLPRTRLLAQGQGWGDERWETIADVFAGFSVEEAPTAVRGEVRRALVTLGTERFPFPEAVASTRALLGESEVFWQVGSTPDPQLRRWATPEAMRTACADADVVVTHAGVGSILMALTLGKLPVVLPRRRARGEHVDDHQLEIAERLEERGLVVRATPETLSWDHLDRAASARVRRRPPVPAAALAG